MKSGVALSLVLALAGVAAGGYWLGMRANPERGTHVDAASMPAATASMPRKLLYYRNPMGLPDTSPVPKKDPMGMDYVAVYEGEDPQAEAVSAGQIKISTEKVQKLGVRTEPVMMRSLGKKVRAAGRVEPDERRIAAITPKFEGYVERLHVAVTGQPVVKGQPLFEVYSPELVSAQREYAIAMQGLQTMQSAGADAKTGMRQLADSALVRLRNWDLPSEQLEHLVNTGQATRSVTFRSPATGIVTEKKALQGMRFMPGEMLYQVTDLSSVWVVADIPEQDIAAVRVGARTSVRIGAYPNRTFDGLITYIYPTLKIETRTVPVRVELSNPGMLLKPAMFAQVEVAVGTAAPVLAVPDSAVIDSGKRRLVLVQLGEGRFEPREVELGERGENHVQVLKGVSDGELVVVAANFLIDAESNLRAAVGGMGAHAGHGAATKGASAPIEGASADKARPQVSHKATGTVDSVNPKSGSLMLSHSPIASLNWPAMTMEFQLATQALLEGVQAGQRVEIEFVERKPGEFVVTSIRPMANPGPTTTSARPAADRPASSPTRGHSGH